MDPAAEGKVYPAVPFEVDPGRVAAFRGLFAAGDAGTGEGVPPTFVTAAEFLLFPQVVSDPDLGLDLSRVLHGGQDYAFVRPLRAGETLTAETRIDSIRIRAGNGFLVLVTELRDGAGELVATGRSTMVERGDA